MEFLVIMFGISVVCGLICFLCFSQKRKLQQELDHENTLHPDCEYPKCIDGNIRLLTISGVGTAFMGEFRKINIEGYNSYVTYRCMVLLFLVFPMTAYRVIPTSGKWDTSPSWKILGSVTGKSSEMSCIRYRFYGIWSGIVACISTLLLISASMFYY